MPCKKKTKNKVLLIQLNTILIYLNDDSSVASGSIVHVFSHNKFYNP